MPLSTKKGYLAYCLNYCEACMCATSGVTRLRGNGDRILECNQHVPKIMFYNLERLATEPSRDEDLQRRAEDGQLGVQKIAKARRDRARAIPCSLRGKQYECETGNAMNHT